MGRAHHDGQQLEHLPEMRLGEEHGRATGAPKLAVAQFGLGKKVRLMLKKKQWNFLRELEYLSKHKNSLDSYLVVSNKELL